MSTDQVRYLFDGQDHGGVGVISRNRVVPDFQRYWRSAQITSSPEGVYTTSYPDTRFE